MEHKQALVNSIMHTWVRLIYASVVLLFSNSYFCVCVDLSSFSVYPSVCTSVTACLCPCRPFRLFPFRVPLIVAQCPLSSLVLMQHLATVSALCSSVFLYASLYVPVCVTAYMSVRLPISFTCRVSVFYLSECLSLSVSVSVYRLCDCLSVCLCLYVCLFLGDHRPTNSKQFCSSLCPPPPTFILLFVLLSLSLC